MCVLMLARFSAGSSANGTSRCSVLLHPFPRFSDAAPQGNGRLPAECRSCPGNIQHDPWHIEVAARLVDRFRGAPCGLADDVDDLRDGRAFATSGVEAPPLALKLKPLALIAGVTLRSIRLGHEYWEDHMNRYVLVRTTVAV